jgi:hypothetical protein
VTSPSHKKNSSGGSMINFQEIMKRLYSTIFSHPFLVLSVSMICDPLVQGDNWFIAYWKFLAKYGVAGYYNGLR